MLLFGVGALISLGDDAESLAKEISPYLFLESDDMNFGKVSLLDCYYYSIILCYY